MGYCAKNINGSKKDTALTSYRGKFFQIQKCFYQIGTP
jgi:hypothetical protein